MNNACYGYFFQRWGKRWLRCFLDSTMIATDETPTICPACGRRWETSEPFKDWDPDNDYRVQLAVDLPYWKAQWQDAMKNDGILRNKINDGLDWLESSMFLSGMTADTSTALTNLRLLVNWGIGYLK